MDRRKEEFDNLRQLIALDLLHGGDVDAKTSAAMISRLDKLYQTGVECPGYVGLLKEVEDGIN
jgi:hypothetical protein